MTQTQKETLTEREQPSIHPTGRHIEMVAPIIITKLNIYPSSAAAVAAIARPLTTTPKQQSIFPCFVLVVVFLPKTTFKRRWFPLQATHRCRCYHIEGAWPTHPFSPFITRKIMISIYRAVAPCLCSISSVVYRVVIKNVINLILFVKHRRWRLESFCSPPFPCLYNPQQSTVTEAPVATS